MAKANETSPATNQPRSPNADELRQLADWLQSHGHDEYAAEIATYAYVAVYDHYTTDSPGYAGKLMSVVWSGSPTFFDVFTWEDGKIERGDRDYDEKECCGCGAKNGTLCGNCWRHYWGRLEQADQAACRSSEPNGIVPENNHEQAS